jgi:selenocysteine-specific elongation factor
VTPEPVGRAVVGVIGHVDHGKTALVRALTGMETDRLAEEKMRGISIALGFAHLERGRSAVDLIDMPGHERFVRTMIAGATGIDAVLLVVAANEGVSLQTREHVEIAGLLGIERAVVAVTKCDLVDDDEAQLVGEEAAELLSANGIRPLPLSFARLRLREEIGGGGSPHARRFDDRPHPNPSPQGEGLSGAYILTSTLTDMRIAELTTALLDLTDSTPPRSADGTAWLPIDRAFTIPGHGAVVTGTLRGGELRPGDTLILHPAAKPVRVRGVQVHGAPVDIARPGQRTAVNLRDVTAAELARGMALAAPDALTPSEWLTISLRSAASAPPLANGVRLRALFGTSEVDARLRLLDRDVLEPGDTALAQLHLAEPAALPAREHAVLRIASPARTVAGGRVLEPTVRRRRRHDPIALARLAALRDLAPEAWVAAEVLTADTALADLTRLSALSPDRVRALLASLPVTLTRSGIVLREADLAALAERLPRLIGREPLGLSRGRIAALLPGTRAAAIDEALRRLLAEGVLGRHGSQFTLMSAGANSTRAQTEAEHVAAIAELLRLAGLSPPNPSAIVVDALSARAVDVLLKRGTIVRALDRAKHREMLFHRDAILQARTRLAPLLVVEPGLLATEIGAALGISRKYTMPLVDHLDTIGFTQRCGDRRVAGRAAKQA